MQGLSLLDVDAGEEVQDGQPCVLALASFNGNKPRADLLRLDEGVDKGSRLPRLEHLDKGSSRPTELVELVALVEPVELLRLEQLVESRVEHSGHSSRR